MQFRSNVEWVAEPRVREKILRHGKVTSDVFWHATVQSCLLCKGVDVRQPDAPRERFGRLPDDEEALSLVWLSEVGKRFEFFHRRDLDVS